MKKNLSLFLISLFFQFSFAQTTTNYWIQLKDKKNSPYLISKPSGYLSEKAIARREKQHILINSSDLPVNSIYVNQIKSIGVAVTHKSKWFNAILVSCSDESKIDAIKAMSFVKEIKAISSPAIINSFSKFEFENYHEPVQQEKSGSNPTTTSLNYGLSYKQANQIGADCMHDLGFQGQGMTIAVIDAGFLNANTLPAFDTLRLNDQILGCRDFVIGDTLVYEDYPHGMNVLSCIGANLPGRIVGTAPKAKFWLLRTEDAATESLQEEINWLVGAEFADSVGADIITSSLGYSVFDNPSENHTYADLDGRTTIITKASSWAQRKGMFVIIAAGNSAGAPWYKITAPGDADSILTVGAVDSLGNIGSFSSRGPSYDGRIKPNTCARGVQSVVASQYGDVWQQSGTSFATPITAGAVACLWQAHPNSTNIQLLEAIEQGASQYSTPDSIKGFGIPDFCMANSFLSGIEKNQVTTGNLSVFPNPFDKGFVIRFYSDKKQTLKIELSDISGRQIISFTKNAILNTNNEFRISEMENLSAGIYILQLKTTDKVYSQKIVKE